MKLQAFATTTQQLVTLLGVRRMPLQLKASNEGDEAITAKLISNCTCQRDLLDPDERTKGSANNWKFSVVYACYACS